METVVRKVAGVRLHPRPCCETAMNATQTEGKTSTKDDEQVATEFWQSLADRILETDSDRQGCFEVELAGEHRVRTCPVFDAGVSNVNGEPALMLPLPVDGKPPVNIDGVVGLSVGSLHMTATVARTERSGHGVLTIYLIDPQLSEQIIPGGEPTMKHLEYLGA